MNLVPAMGKFDSQFGSNNSTAAVRGITRDSDFHAVQQDTRDWMSAAEARCKNFGPKRGSGCPRPGFDFVYTAHLGTRGCCMQTPVAGPD